MSGLLPVVSDKVPLTADAVAATDIWLQGLRINQLLELLGIVSAATAGQNGFGVVGSQLCYVDATSGLPAGTIHHNGLPFNSTGQLCVSTGATSYHANGIPFTANGAVSVTLAGGNDPAILMEDGSYLLLEDGSRILLE